MRILVTGGAGYVGSVVVQQLLAAGHQVWVLDTLTQGHRQAVSSGAELTVGDIGDRDLVRSLLTGNRIDAVAHLAAATVISRSFREPRLFYEENVVKAISLLHTMLDCGVNRIVFSSTASIFGEPQFTPLTEEHPSSPISNYGHSKLAFERVLDAYGPAYGLRSVVFRYFNASGASGDLGEDHRPESHVIPILFRAILSDGAEPFDIFGQDYNTPDGTCIRDYVHVRDLGIAHVQAIEQIDRIGTGRYNLGTGTGVSVLQLAECAQSAAGRKLRIRFQERRPGDPSILVASPEKARRELGWEPAHSRIENILETAFEWMRRHPEGYAE